jgi:hypothetical protein
MKGRVCALIYLGLFGQVLSKADVYIPDPNLKLAIQQALGIAEPQPEDMLALTYLSASDMGIKDLTGLEYAVNLRALYLSWNQIADISPLAGLTNLEDLDINNNRCSDIGPLSGLVNLRYLNIHMNQVTGLSPLVGLYRLKILVARLNAISDVGPLAGLTNLTELDLRDNLISDISPLANLTGLIELCLSNNRISDIGPLAGLSHIQTLWLSENLISDLSPLQGLDGLQYLYLAYNYITDISPLKGLKGLKALDLQANPLDEDAYNTYIPQIIQNNPGIRCWYDCRSTRTLQVSSAGGGRVVQPGVGVFEYNDGAVVYLQAQAYPGFEFVGWRGTFASPCSNVFIIMDQDHQVRAYFVSLSNTIIVDSGLPANGFEDGTDLHPFHSIQQALDVAPEGAMVLVRPGNYCEPIQIGQRAVTITGIDPITGPPQSYPVIQPDGTDPVLTISGNPKVTLEGLVISGISDRTRAAIDCVGSSLTIANCLLVGNRCLGPTGAALSACDSDIVLTRSTIVDNLCGMAAIVLTNSRISISDSIICSNHPAQVLADLASTLAMHRSYIPGLVTAQNMADLIEDAGSVGLFVRRGYWADPADLDKPADPLDPDAVWVQGDYHLIDQTIALGAYTWPDRP